MKKRMLLASLVLIVLTAANAQDTIKIKPFDRALILLTGKDLKELATANNIELLKNRFIEDYYATLNEKDFPADAHMVYYLVSADGRRRLRTKPDTETNFSIDQEINDFMGNLPPLHYIIYDLQKSFQYHFFLTDTAQLRTLAATNLTTLLIEATANADKKLNRYTKLDISQSDNKWKALESRNKKSDMLELNVPVGIGLINNQPTPVVGINVELVLANRYGHGKFRFGGMMNFRVLADYQKLSFQEINLVTTPTLHFLVNMAQEQNKQSWFGLSAGRMKTSIDNPLNKAWQVGLIYENNNYGVHFDFIRDQNNKVNYAVTLYLNF